MSSSSNRKSSRLKVESVSKARRRLIQTLALAPMLPSVLTTGGLSLGPTESKPSAKPTSALPQSPSPELKPSPEAESLAEIVQQRYGKYLNDDQIGEIKLLLERGLRGRRRLREFKLTNADEPATVFFASE